MLGGAALSLVFLATEGHEGCTGVLGLFPGSDPVAPFLFQVVDIPTRGDGLGPLVIAGLQMSGIKERPQFAAG